MPLAFSVCDFADCCGVAHDCKKECFYMFGFKGSSGGNENRVRPKLIRYDFPDNTTLIHKESGYPILQDSQLIVSPSQTALMVRNGQIYKRFESGAQVLDTGLLLSTLKSYEKTFDGGENGLPVDIYFINNLFSAPMPWGTPNPIQIIDPSIELYIKVVANGQLRYQIVDPELYIKTNMYEDVDNLNSLCKKKIIAHFTQEIQRYVQNEKIGYFELSAQTVKISERLRDIINARLVGEEGFKIVEFTVSGFYADEEDLEILKNTKGDVMRMKREAEARAYARNVEGYSYQDERRFDVMQEAAGNQGNLGGVMGTMIGATLGVGMGNEIGQKVAGQTMNPPQPSAAPMSNATCSSCGASVPAGAKFCSQCGSPIAAQTKKFCTGCGTQLDGEARFCPSCGKPQ